MLICFYLAIAIQTLGTLCKEKTLSILSNGHMVENSSSYPGIQCDWLAKVSKPTTTLGVAGLKRFVILTSKSQEIVSLDYMTIEGSFPSV